MKNVVGTSLLLLALIGFFFFMQVLGIFGSQIEYKDPAYMIKSSIPWLFTFSCMYLGLRMLSDHQNAKQMVKNIGLPLVVAYFIGLILHW